MVKSIMECTYAICKNWIWEKCSHIHLKEKAIKILIENDFQFIFIEIEKKLKIKVHSQVLSIDRNTELCQII